MFAAAFFALASASSLDEQFAQFQKQYSRVYKDSAEYYLRRNCFQYNLEEAARLSASQPSATFGVNKYSDLCKDEFKTWHNLRVSNNKPKNYSRRFSGEELAKIGQDPVDWRTKNAVTPIKDQGQCGSCWAFSSTGNMEGQYAIAKGNLLSFSEEELVQCAKNGNYGCQGGLMDNAFQWVISNNGIDSESDYPYTSGGGNTGKCNAQKKGTHVAAFTSYNDLPNSEDQMYAWMATNGPIAIAVDASQVWQSYTGGIVKNCNTQNLDHGVLAVGYGTENGVAYWIVKNSWGTSWGENGYIRLAYGSNQCGLNKMPSSIKV